MPFPAHEVVGHFVKGRDAETGTCRGRGFCRAFSPWAQGGELPRGLPTSFANVFAPEGQPESSAALQCRVRRKEKFRPGGAMGTQGMPRREGSRSFPASLRDEPLLYGPPGTEVPGYSPVAPPGQG